MAKKIKLRYGRIAAALSVLAAIIIILYLGISWLFNWIYTSWGDKDEAIEPKAIITPEMRACDTIMARRLDSLMNIPQNLDTSLIAISVYDATTESQVYEFHADKSMAPALHEGSYSSRSPQNSRNELQI